MPSCNRPVLSHFSMIDHHTIKVGPAVSQKELEKALNESGDTPTNSRLPHPYAAIENALVHLTQREPFHRTTPVLVGFLRFLVVLAF